MSPSYSMELELYDILPIQRFPPASKDIAKSQQNEAAHNCQCKVQGFPLLLRSSSRIEITVLGVA
eukprot:2917288-Pleurochrysis_carterae.AAC.3